LRKGGGREEIYNFILKRRGPFIPYSVREEGSLNSRRGKGKEVYFPYSRRGGEGHLFFEGGTNAQKGDLREGRGKWSNRIQGGREVFSLSEGEKKKVKGGVGGRKGKREKKKKKNQKKGEEEKKKRKGRKVYHFLGSNSFLSEEGGD